MDIPEYIPFRLNKMYLVYSDGRIYTKYRKKFLSPTISSGYYAVSLSIEKRKKFRRIHRLVASHFVENPNKEKYNIVDHIDRNRFNNHFTNLRWTDNSGNVQNAEQTHHKRGVIQRGEDKKVVAEYSTVSEGSRQSGISKRMILFSCTDGLKTRDKKERIYYWSYKKQQQKISKPVGSKKIPGFEHYFITKEGKVYSSFKKNYLRTHLSKDGYERLSLKYKNFKKTFTVHQLVAQAFLSDPIDDNMQINHKDGVRSNNRLSNLEYVTAAENVRHMIQNNPQRKRPIMMLDPKTSTVIKRYDSIMEAAEDVGMHFTSIGNAARGVSKSAGGYQWRYDDKKIRKI